jgi:1-acyl-sn-glycerol-3-phosphate acyltransferase
MLSVPATIALSWAILAALAIALVAAFATHYRRRTEYRWAILPIYIINLFYCRIVWRTRVVGRWPTEALRGGAVIICNHKSPLDPAFIQLVNPKMAHWMVAREYSLHPAMKWVFDLFGVIPVNRGGTDTAATKAAIRYAENGELVGLFPEGRINDTDAVLLPGRPGVAMIALRARVPVLPCYLHGSPYNGTEWGQFVMPAKVTLVIGEPIDISRFYDQEPDKPVLEELTKIFLTEMAKLAGAKDFVPELAGRFYKPGREAQPVAAAVE